MSAPAPAWLLAAAVGLLGACATTTPPRLQFERPNCGPVLTVSEEAGGHRLGGDPVYDQVLEDTVVFSEDGDHVAYVALRGQQWLVVSDGVEQAWDGVAFLHQTAQGPVYAGQRGEQWCVVRGKSIDPCFASLYEDSLTLTAGVVAYVGLAADGTATLMVNGTPMGKGAALALVRVSDDGKHVGYVERAQKDGDGDKVFLDGEVLATAPRIFDWSPAAGGVWVAQRDGGWMVESKSWTLGPYVSVSPLQTRADHVAGVAHSTAGAVLMLDGKTSRVFEDATDTTLILSRSGTDAAVEALDRSPDGVTRAVVTTMGNVFDPARGRGVIRRVKEIALSDDGHVVGMVGADATGNHRLLVVLADTGKELWWADRFEDISDVTLSPDGGRAVVLVRRGESFFVLQHCLSCGSEPTAAPVGRAMPGTLVADAKVEAWAVMKGQRVPGRPAEKELVVTGSWSRTGQSAGSIDRQRFGNDVIRLGRTLEGDALVEAWRLQVQRHLQRHACNAVTGR